MNRFTKKEINNTSGKTDNNKGANAKNKTNAYMRKNSEKHYKCYSIKLNEFLKSNNLKTIREVRHPKTNKIAFVYEKSKQLDELLTIWTNNKNKM